VRVFGQEKRMDALVVLGNGEVVRQLTDKTPPAGNSK